jgi:uncharacterized protein (DUF433 family)
MRVVLSTDDRHFLEKLVQRKLRPTRRQKAQALLGLADGESPEIVAQRVGIPKQDIVVLVNRFVAGGLHDVGLGAANGTKSGAAIGGFHARIQKTRGVCGGAARIAGTRIPVWQLVEARDIGASEAQLLIDYPRLKAADLVEAWRYADAHPTEIESAIHANQLS